MLGSQSPVALHRIFWPGAALTILAWLGLTVLAPQAQAVRCAVPELNAYKALVRPVDKMERTHGPGDYRTPPANPQVGDSWTWYTWRLNGPPTPDPKVCTVRGMGQHVYVVVENSQWLTRVDQADVDAVVEAWDNSSLGQWPTKGIYELDTESFGPVPDMLDNDQRVYVLYYDFDVSSDGFFWFFDEYPDGTQPYASNECEVLYMNSSDFDPGGDYLISVQAHEFEHMIHWLADDSEESWVDEGMAEMGMWLYGLPDDVVLFPNSPDNNLTTFSGNFVDYVKVYLWSLYFYEHFGGQPSLLNLVSQPANGPAGYQATLAAMGYSTTFAQLTADWVTANYLDDPGLEGGKYNYAGEDLPTFASVTKSTYPVPATNATVNHYAADYVKFINGQPQQLNFNGGDTAEWSARAIKYLAGNPLSVEDIPLNPTDDGSIALTDFGSGYDQVVLVIANVAAGGVTSYQYSTSAAAGIESIASVAPGVRLYPAGPNPFSGETSMRLVLDQPGRISAAVYNPMGQALCFLAQGSLPSGEHLLRWDGRDAAGRRLSSGMYYLRVEGAGGVRVGEKLILMN